VPDEKVRSLLPYSCGVVLVFLVLAGKRFWFNFGSNTGVSVFGSSGKLAVFLLRRDQMLCISVLGDVRSDLTFS